MKDRELIKVLVEAVRPFADVDLGPGARAPLYQLSHTDVRTAKAAMTDYRIWQDTPRSDPLPWDPSSACEVPAEMERAEQQKRNMARQNAKELLVARFQKCHELMGIRWGFGETTNVCAIVDAILMAAGR